ncbi:prepilin-type N-terminal cleavage/methylation domain-containing protein [Fibrobacter sp. UWB10]|uniref:PilW family protein n=1 Tax=Fibrobacter sp. UWB10 TaxID=1896201 RepID=UPI0024039F18|nr:prepilin-type N-terminal cleavage/methylation domain-containing protein [Fibrobacter sp. UWB10]SMP50991.1 prepilin-type N-terminal cleavage/methylation domain-containing protein [Fibrobacter sp. UWB10]
MRSVNGFTLIELLVAVVAASIVSLVALQVYGSYHRLYLHLYGEYQKETAAILEDLRRINPYDLGPCLRR